MTDNQQKPSGLSAFWQELRRRHVVRVAITYAVVAWLIIQIASSTFGWFDIPVWAYRFVVFMVILGFPLAIILAWAFELTPDGIKTSRSAREDHPEAHKDESVQRKRNRFSLLLAAGLPTAIFGALALFFFFSRSAPSDSELAPTEQIEQENDKSIAVLPLENLSPDPDNAFFADGVHEDILTNLSKIKELLVIGRTSTLQYRDTVKTLQQIGEELSVRYLVQGSVRRAGDQVLVTVQLIDSQTEGHLWAENYNRQLDDIFAIQAAIAREVANELETVISPSEIALIERQPTENLEAYEFYVKHRELDGGEEKIALLEKAVALDPNFAEAWAALATETIFWYDVGRNRSVPELRERARYALEQAARTGPKLPHLQIAEHTMALRDDRDLEKAVEFLLEALAIDPAFYLAHTRLGQRYYQLGRLAESQHHLEMALKYDPFYNVANFLLHDVFRARELWSEAKDFNLKNTELGYGFNQFKNWNIITNQYLETGDKQAFVTAIELSRTLKGVPRSQLAQLLLQRDLGKALALSASLDSADPTSFYSLRDEPFYFDIEPSELLAALIYFEQTDDKNALTEAEKAQRYIKKIIDENPKAFPSYWSSLIICYALTGESDPIPETIDLIREKTDTIFWKYDYQVRCELHIAIAYLVLGDHDKAIETLEAASKVDASIFLNRELDLWFIFDRLRGDPRFDALLEG